MAARTAFPPEQQLIAEGYVKDLDASLAFYKHYEFEVLREEPHHFAELACMEEPHMGSKPSLP